MDKCLCGKGAIGFMFCPTNIFSGLKEVFEKQPVCSYHMDKAAQRDFKVELTPNVN